MVAKYRMLKRRNYMTKDGQPKTAHNLEVTVPDVGTGDLYISEHLYQAIKSLGLSDGDLIDLQFDLNVYRGAINSRLAAVALVSEAVL